MKYLKITAIILGSIALVIAGFFGGVYFIQREDFSVSSPAIFNTQKEKELPLLAYTIPALRERSYQPRTITITEELSTTEEFTSYVFEYNALGKKMTGQLNVPATVTATTPVIVMLRGYVPLSIFTTGVGTKNAAAVFAREGFITIAPDFFGYGESDPEPSDSWQARFEKPIAVIELIETIRQKGTPVTANLVDETTAQNIVTQSETPLTQTPALHKTDRIGIWGHSNGGQIAMSTLVAMQESIPTTLWAPVLVPFPYSILYFTDENEDEGKGMRIWLSQLEDDYELRDFSFTKYLDGLVGPLQIQHGTNDEAAPHIWSNEFVDKLLAENKRRAKKLAEIDAAENASESAETIELLQSISYDYIQYPGADHNLQPNANWEQAVTKDLEFFRRELLD